MIVRWLVVVLTMAGAIPVHVCTCGAAHHHHTTTTHDQNHDDSAPAIEADSDAHHDADCHAVRPRPLMSLGLVCDVTDVPPVDALVVALVGLIPPAPAVGELVREPHPPPDRPLFLSFCVLRN